VGNSETGIGVFQDDALVLSWRLRTQARTPDEALLVLRQLLAPESIDLARLPSVLCSVVPAVTSELAHGLTRLTGVPTLVVGAKTVPSMPVRVEEPSSVGPDRLANAIAAREIYGAPAVVVDLGTATNFDVVGPDGDFLGGAIAPGLSSSAEEMFRRAARLRPVDLVHPERAIGRSSEEALQAGIVLGHAGMVDALVTRILEELGVAATVIATGGLSPLLGEEASTIDHVEPALTLQGLRIIHALLASSSPVREAKPTREPVHAASRSAATSAPSPPAAAENGGRRKRRGRRGGRRVRR
jgi:type III pantothenate kinase